MSVTVIEQGQQQDGVKDWTEVLNDCSRFGQRWGTYVRGVNANVFWREFFEILGVDVDAVPAKVEVNPIPGVSVLWPIRIAVASITDDRDLSKASRDIEKSLVDAG